MLRSYRNLWSQDTGQGLLSYVSGWEKLTTMVVYMNGFGQAVIKPPREAFLEFILVMGCRQPDWAFQAPAAGYSDVIGRHSEWYFLETVKVSLVTDDYFFRMNLWCTSMSKLETPFKYSCHKRVLHVNDYFGEIVLSWVTFDCDR